ncbi:hypothetical protein M5K25_025027 [Dendrobium thyrsiflorum]|uniref:Uncharacterized protein n=1 Tax=Dendrobium thyrsiflorum TaxID=117978 RepID=A0ABD0U3I4_DENTH
MRGAAPDNAANRPVNAGTPPPPLARLIAWGPQARPMRAAGTARAGSRRGPGWPERNPAALKCGPGAPAARAATFRPEPFSGPISGPESHGYCKPENIIRLGKEIPRSHTRDESARMIGLELDLSEKAPAVRFHGYAILLEDLKVKVAKANVTEGGDFAVSDAEEILDSL